MSNSNNRVTQLDTSVAFASSLEQIHQREDARRIKEYESSSAEPRPVVRLGGILAFVGDERALVVPPVPPETTWNQNTLSHGQVPSFPQKSLGLTDEEAGSADSLWNTTGGLVKTSTSPNGHSVFSSGSYSTSPSATFLLEQVSASSISADDPSLPREYKLLNRNFGSISPQQNSVNSSDDSMSTSTESCFLLEPRPNDVVYGRGKKQRDHPGNIRCVKSFAGSKRLLRKLRIPPSPVFLRPSSIR